MSVLIPSRTIDCESSEYRADSMAPMLGLAMHNGTLLMLLFKLVLGPSSRRYTSEAQNRRKVGLTIDEVFANSLSGYLGSMAGTRGFVRQDGFAVGLSPRRARCTKYNKPY